MNWCRTNNIPSIQRYYKPITSQLGREQGLLEKASSVCPSMTGLAALVQTQTTWM